MTSAIELHRPSVRGKRSGCRHGFHGRPSVARHARERFVPRVTRTPRHRSRARTSMGTAQDWTGSPTLPCASPFGYHPVRRPADEPVQRRRHQRAGVAGRCSGHPAARSLLKERPVLDEHSRAFISRSPLLLMATAGRDGRCDVSPKGDGPGFVLVLDDHRLVIPDRPGNKRLDGMRNLLVNPHVGLIFLVPGREETLRVNGRAWITRDRRNPPTMCRAAGRRRRWQSASRSSSASCTARRRFAGHTSGPSSTGRSPTPCRRWPACCSIKSSRTG